jgi:hypothetical protein
VGEAGAPQQTIRPHPAALIGLPAAYAAIVAAGVVGDPPEGAGQLAVVILFVVATLGSAVVAVKERVVVEGPNVRVIRLFTSDVVARSTIERVAQAGRGRPASLVTASGGIRLPALMTSRRLAREIDVPLTTHHGGSVADHPFRDFVSAARDPEGRIRPVAWAYAVGLVAMFTLFVAMIAAPA